MNAIGFDLNTLVRAGWNSLKVLAVCAALQSLGLPAIAQQFQYHGVSTQYPQIHMELTITTRYADATGMIYDGNYRYPVKGTFSNGALSAMTDYVTRSISYSAPVSGGLSGGPLGTGRITAFAHVAFNGPVLSLTFDLQPNSAPPAASSAQPAPTSAPTPPSVMRLNGSVGFGYTRASLALNMTLKGSSYLVSGTMVVNQIRPSLLQRTLTISGVLTPGVPGQLSISGAFPGDNPAFSATLSGRRFEGLITGIPSLDITHLFIGAN